LHSPSGVTIQFHQDLKLTAAVPEQFDCAVLQFNQANSWVTGRAGMLYRDLIPSRLSGAIIASNIMIAQGGPVPDHVHYHSIQFQLIFCTKGWVKVVYEDQGEPFILTAGDCVTQPPGIRHQVLEASDGLEVLEIGLPAEHMTTLDYQMTLPSNQHLPQRLYGEDTNNQQMFCHHQHSTANWQLNASQTILSCQTAVAAACGGIAAVNLLRKAGEHQVVNIEHQDKLRFYYMMAGHAELKMAGSKTSHVTDRDSWLLPKATETMLSGLSADFQCIEFILQ
jgi:quercetin dioxygenase-like cupin family protein